MSKNPSGPAMLLSFVGLLLAAGCVAKAKESRPFTISAIPDQDPERLQRLYSSVAEYLSTELGQPVVYKPVIDYRAAIIAFKAGDLDLVWYGGLTGVQARLQVPGARAILQRDVDERFRSVFIANTKSGITDLASLKGRTFTFGSESSTSGRLMPQHFLSEAGIRLEDFKGAPGFSGSHDKTIELVTAGTYDAGVLNGQVWKARLEKGTVDTRRVGEIATTPPYHDYHWVLHPGATARFGDDLARKIEKAFLGLDPLRSEHRHILSLFSATCFIVTEDANYAEVEAVGRKVGLIVTSVAAR